MKKYLALILTTGLFCLFGCSPSYYDDVTEIIFDWTILSEVDSTLLADDNLTYMLTIDISDVVAYDTITSGHLICHYRSSASYGADAYQTHNANVLLKIFRVNSLVMDTTFEWEVLEFTESEEWGPDTCYKNIYLSE